MVSCYMCHYKFYVVKGNNSQWNDIFIVTSVEFITRCTRNI